MLGSGVMRFGACAACGVRIALGNDSANTGGRHDLFAAMRLGMMLPRRDGGDFHDWPRPATMFAAATEGGAAALGLNGRLGRIAVGQLADLVLLDAAGVSCVAAAPTLDVLVQHAGPEHVDSVMVDGNWVMRSGRILAFDEAAVISEAKGHAAAVRERVAGGLPVLRAAMPEIAGGLQRRMCG
jgi:5-methylthioadenosine/S-adenosylhomocysteine deaminase